MDEQRAGARGAVCRLEEAAAAPANRQVAGQPAWGTGFLTAVPGRESHVTLYVENLQPAYGHLDYYQAWMVFQDRHPVVLGPVTIGPQGRGTVTLPFDPASVGGSGRPYSEVMGIGITAGGQPILEGRLAWEAGAPSPWLNPVVRPEAAWQPPVPPSLQERTEETPVAEEPAEPVESAEAEPAEPVAVAEPAAAEGPAEIPTAPAKAAETVAPEMAEPVPAVVPEPVAAAANQAGSASGSSFATGSLGLVTPPETSTDLGVTAVDNPNLPHPLTAAAESGPDKTAAESGPAEAPAPAPAPTPAAPTAPPGFTLVPEIQLNLEPQHTAAFRSTGTAVLGIPGGSTLITLRHMSAPAHFGKSSATSRDYSVFRAWLAHATRPGIVEIGALKKIWDDTYRLQVTQGVELANYDTLFITVEDTTVSPDPVGPTVMAGRYQAYQKN